MNQKENHFRKHHKVPQDFFENLNFDEFKTSKSRSKKMLNVQWAAPLIGFSLILIIALYYNDQSVPSADQTIDFTSEEFETYIVSELSSDLLMTEYSDHYYDGSSQSEIEDYLDEEIDTEILINQL